MLQMCELRPKKRVRAQRGWFAGNKKLGENVKARTRERETERERDRERERQTEREIGFFAVGLSCIVNILN